jgi:hypothetical protein
MKKVAILLIILLFQCSLAHSQIVQFSGASVSTGITTFTPLTLRFMSPTGSDANSGVDAAHPWATPNHAMNCGDVIIAAPSTAYSPGMTFGVVSNCPSTTGGIDGTGGIYTAILLCGGPDLEACKSTGAGSDVFPLQNNWAIEGWKCDGNGNSRCFMANAPTQTTILHHIAMINDVAVNAKQGFGMNDCPGGTCNHNVPGDGTDYWAVVGSIAQNASQDTGKLAAIDFVGPANFDAVAGTHGFIHGNFAWNNVCPSCSTDSEAFMADTLDAHGYTGKVIFSNNISYTAQRFGFQLVYQAFNVSTPTVKFYNNTSYANLTNVGTDSADGEYNINGGGPYIVSVTNNIGLTSGTTSPGSGQNIYALIIGGGTWTAATIGGIGSENVFLRPGASSCGGPDLCDSTNSVGEFNSNSFGTNTYANPNFTNTSDLTTNRNGAPNCTGKENVTQCMGYDAQTGTLTTPSVISDLTPTGTCGSVACSTKGYQKPTTTCPSNADYPVWLKGIVYLHWTGSIIQQKAGLVTTPCGL